MVELDLNPFSNYFQHIKNQHCHADLPLMRERRRQSHVCLVRQKEEFVEDLHWRCENL